MSQKSQSGSKAEDKMRVSSQEAEMAIYLTESPSNSYNTYEPSVITTQYVSYEENEVIEEFGGIHYEASNIML